MKKNIITVITTAIGTIATLLIVAGLYRKANDINIVEAKQLKIAHTFKCNFRLMSMGGMTWVAGTDSNPNYYIYEVKDKGKTLLRDTTKGGLMKYEYTQTLETGGDLYETLLKGDFKSTLLLIADNNSYMVTANLLSEYGTEIISTSKGECIAY